MIHPKRSGKRRDPDTILLDRTGGRTVAWVACERKDRVLLIDLSDPASPRLLARRIAGAPPRDLLRVDTPFGQRLLTANGNGTLSVFAVQTAL